MTWQLWLIIGLGIAAAVGLALWPPIRQDLRYHDFMDQRMLLGRQHALNVWSNAPFVGVGIAGVIWLTSQPVPDRWIWVSFFVGVTLTGLGSGDYHLQPDSAPYRHDANSRS